MRAVIYARYSTDHQREASIEDQVEVCRRADRACRAGSCCAPTRTGRSAAPAAPGRATSSCCAMPSAAPSTSSCCEALDRLGRKLADVAALHDGWRSAASSCDAVDWARSRRCTSACSAPWPSLPLRPAREDPARPAGPGAAGPHRRRPRLRLRRGRRCARAAGGAAGRSTRPRPKWCAGSSACIAAGESPRAIARKRLNAERRSRTRTAGPGGTPRSAARSSAAPACSTTSSTPAGWSGTAAATSRTRAPASGWRGPIAPAAVGERRGAGAAHRRRRPVAGGQGAPGRGALRDRPRRGRQRAQPGAPPPLPALRAAGLRACAAAATRSSASDRYGCAGHRNKGTCANDRTISRPEIEGRVLDGLRTAAGPGAVRGVRPSFQEEVQPPGSTEARRPARRARGASSAGWSARSRRWCGRSRTACTRPR